MARAGPSDARRNRSRPGLPGLRSARAGGGGVLHCPVRSPPLGADAVTGNTGLRWTLVLYRLHAGPHHDSRDRLDKPIFLRPPGPAATDAFERGTFQLVESVAVGKHRWPAKS